VQEFLTVSQLNGYIEALLSGDPLLVDLWVKGEISGLKVYQQSGHIYFTLKDRDSAVSCVMFRSRARSLKFRPEEGMEVLLRGYVSVFSRQGRYQLYAQEMQPFGLGGLYLQLEQLKQRLAAAGYFDEGRKKSLPRLVQRVGIVTSRDGAALRDILRVLRQRYQHVDVVLVHSSVQGAEAPRELADGIRILNEYAGVEVIIVGRGGGSLEDLMAFNSEDVVQAIFDSQIPVISAVGHEVDFTLSDLAADIRAATPTQAAQMAVPELMVLEEMLQNMQARMGRALLNTVAWRTEALDRVMMRRVWQESPLIKDSIRSLNELNVRLARAMQDRLGQALKRQEVAGAALGNLSPLRVLERGYALVKAGERLVRDVDRVEPGQVLQVLLHNGELEVEVRSRKKGEHGEVEF
jgi:exodeoxyribonuclease VII large subunit